MMSDPNTVAGWRCLTCDGRSYARVDEQKVDGSFGPGNLVRCVNCKAVYALPFPGEVEEQETTAEDRRMLHEWTRREPTLVNTIVAGVLRDFDRQATALRASAADNARLRGAEAAEAELSRLRRKVEEMVEHRQWGIIAGAIARFESGEREPDYTLGIVDYGFRELRSAFLATLPVPEDRKQEEKPALPNTIGTGGIAPRPGIILEPKP